MNGQIFISYRRDDSLGSTGRIYDRLLDHFPAEQIFMDVDTIPPGEDFMEVIEKAVGNCDVLLAIIGRDWLQIKDRFGRRSLDNDADFVRAEIRAALQRNVKVIPVLVEDADIPNPDDLPEDLKALARRNAIELRHAGFHSDVDRLIKAIKRIISEEAEKARIKAEQKKFRKEQLLAHEKEVQVWQESVQQDSIEAFDAYLNLYAGGKYVAEARKRIVELEQLAIQTEKRKDFALLLAKGQEALAQEQFAEASALFEKALSLFPDSEEGRNWLRRCEVDAEKKKQDEEQELEIEKRKKQEEAQRIKAAEEAQRLAAEKRAKEKKLEEQTSRLEQAGDQWRKKKNYRAALACYEEALTIFPGRSYSLSAAADCRSELQKAEELKRQKWAEEKRKKEAEAERQKVLFDSTPSNKKADTKTRKRFSTKQWLLAGAGIVIMASGIFWLSQKEEKDVVKNNPPDRVRVAGSKTPSIGRSSAGSIVSAPRNVGVQLLQQMVPVNGGAFSMGSNLTVFESPAHQVVVKPFRLSKYEVTREQWNKVMNENKYNGSLQAPATGVSWDEVQRFIEKLNASTKGRFRLPTEAEWEYACLQGHGDDYEQKLDDYSWNASNSGDSLHPVGQKLPNAIGLYDMLGNAYEWCADSKGLYQKRKKDVKRKIIRGGDYASTQQYTSPKIRNWNLKSTPTERIGFRLAMDGND